MIDVFSIANRVEPRYFVTIKDRCGQKEIYLFCDRFEALDFAFNKAQKIKGNNVIVNFKRQLYAIY